MPELPTNKLKKEETMAWVVTVREKLEQRNGQSLDPAVEAQLWNKRSIYKVPSNVYILKNNAYEPKVVSFGPYHHGQENLKWMEEHKQRALFHFAKRSNATLDDLYQALECDVRSLMGTYDYLAGEWLDQKKFLELMMLDGCFMLEVLLTAGELFNDYAHNDPIFSSHGKVYNMPFIRRDMLLIENQIPLLVLQSLIVFQSHREITTNNGELINKLILKFCTHNSSPPKVGKGLHVLDVYRKSMLMEPGRPSSQSQSATEEAPGGGPEIIRSAIELHEAGIRFKRSEMHSLHDITFQSGVLRLPVLVVDDTTESLLLNLMAFERLHFGAGNEVTSYVFFMDNIIDSAKDVSLLHNKGIIQNAVGSDKAVAELFNHLSKDVTLDPNSSLDKVRRQVNKYCQRSWNQWRANLVHTYFRNPWAVLSLVAALFLLALTVAQTFYSIYGYYKPKEEGSDQTSAPPPPAIAPPRH